MLENFVLAQGADATVDKLSLNSGYHGRKESLVHAGLVFGGVGLLGKHKILEYGDGIPLILPRRRRLEIAILTVAEDSRTRRVAWLVYRRSCRGEILFW